MQNAIPLTGSPDPNAVARRLMQTAHTRDGLPEIWVGLTFLAIAGLCYAQIALPKGSAGFNGAVIALALAIPVLVIGSPWILNWIRRRYLIEREGYVQHKPTSRKSIGLGAGLALLAAAAAFIMFPQLSQPDRWILAGTGLFGGSIWALCGRRPRFIAGGAAMAAAGLFVALDGVSLLPGFTILYGVSGLILLLSGAVVFFRFIRRPVETEA